LLLELCCCCCCCCCCRSGTFSCAAIIRIDCSSACGEQQSCQAKTCSASCICKATMPSSQQLSFPRIDTVFTSQVFAWTLALLIIAFLTFCCLCCVA
jgi:hypothetical protein